MGALSDFFRRETDGKTRRRKRQQQRASSVSRFTPNLKKGGQPGRSETPQKEEKKYAIVCNQPRQQRSTRRLLFSVVGLFFFPFFLSLSFCRPFVRSFPVFPSSPWDGPNTHDDDCAEEGQQSGPSLSRLLGATGGPPPRPRVCVCMHASMHTSTQARCPLHPSTMQTPVSASNCVVEAPDPHHICMYRLPTSFSFLFFLWGV